MDCVSLNPGSVIATPGTDRLGRRPTSQPFLHDYSARRAEPRSSRGLRPCMASPTTSPSIPATCPPGRSPSESRLRDGLRRQVPHGRGQRPGRRLRLFVTPGSGKYFDTEFRQQRPPRRQGYYTTVVTRIAEWIAAAAVLALILGHRRFSFYERSRSTHAFDHVNIPIRPAPSCSTTTTPGTRIGLTLGTAFTARCSITARTGPIGRPEGSRISPPWSAATGARSSRSTTA